LDKSRKKATYLNEDQFVLRAKILLFGTLNCWRYFETKRPVTITVEPLTLDSTGESNVIS